MYKKKKLQEKRKEKCLKNMDSINSKFIIKWPKPNWCLGLLINNSYFETNFIYVEILLYLSKKKKKKKFHKQEVVPRELRYSCNGSSDAGSTFLKCNADGITQYSAIGPKGLRIISPSL